MGQTLSEPITVKDTHAISNSQYRTCASSMQGWRISMEDCHTQLLSTKEDKDAAFFAVFDGHGGANVAKYCGEHLHKRVLSMEKYKQNDYVNALQSAFLACDNDMLLEPSMPHEMSGSTAVSVLIKNDKIYCANCGDSRAVMSVDGESVSLSYDHKPSDEEEAKRIVAAGGWVEFDRVNGNLALSRAMGDFVFKRNNKKPPEEQIVTAYPDVIIKDITDSSEFILIACDGIWDVMSNEEVVDFVRNRIAKKLTVEQITEELLNHCLAPDCQLGGLGCDNMTVILVCLLRGKSYDELADKCSRPAVKPTEDENPGGHLPATGSLDSSSEGNSSKNSTAESLRDSEDEGINGPKVSPTT